MIFWDKRELLEVKNAIIERKKKSKEGLESKIAEIPQKVAQKSKKKRKKERKLENQPRKLSISIKEFHQ